jgi:hypothetical protein
MGADDMEARTPAPEGEAWRVVPVEPTEAMLNAAIDVDPLKLGDISSLGFRISPQMLFERCWSAMLAASPVVPKTADEIKAVVMAWLDADDPASWGDFEKRLNAAVSDDAAPVVSVGREEITAILESYIGASAWSDDADAEVHGIPEAADAILAALTQGESRMTGWQDVATAPKDLVVLMFEPHSQGGFMFAGCMGVDGLFHDNLQGVIQNPTHWMPLPAAPTPADGGGE